MLIRAMDIEDLEEVVELERILFATPWTTKDFMYELFENEFSHNYILEDHHHIVGYVGLWVMYEQSQITTIGIDPRFQKQGLGTLLLAQMIEEAKRLKAVQMSLEVRVSNDKAIGLYKKCGFEKVAIRKGYYQDNHEDAYLMVKQWEAEA